MNMGTGCADFRGMHLFPAFIEHMAIVMGRPLASFLKRRTKKSNFNDSTRSRQESLPMERMLFVSKLPYTIYQYYGIILLFMIIGAIASLGLASAVLIWGAVGGWLAVLLVLGTPVISSCCVFLTFYMILHMRVSRDRRSINNNLIYATNFLAAMAVSGKNPETLFAGLARQPVYGSIQRESQWIVRNVHVLNIDILTSLKMAAKRTPSDMFGELLQGIVTSHKSGGSIYEYLVAKSEQFRSISHLRRKRQISSLSILCESFVTAGVAAPLLIIVMLMVILMTGQTAIGSSTAIMTALIYAIIPLIQILFIIGIKSIISS